MAALKKRTSRRQPSGFRAAVLLPVVLVGIFLVGSLVYTSYFKKGADRISSVLTDQSQVSSPRAPAFPPVSSTRIPLPARPHEYEEAPPVVSEKKAPAPPALPGTAARLAIIIDDMGSSMAEARSLAAIKLPLTFSLIPGLRSDREVCDFSIGQGIELMIHVPMQPKEWPSRRLEQNGLLVSMSAEEIEHRMEGFIKKFPEAVGVNNHMGSEFSEQEGKMAAVVQTLKKHNLFFIDSVTSPRSCGFTVAQSGGVRTARRNVFLDNTQEPAYILGQLNQAVAYARAHGSAIAICHPHPVTIATLTTALPKLTGRGIRLVPVSSLVK